MKAYVNCRSFNDTFLPQLDEYIEKMSRQIISNNKIVIRNIIKTKHTLEQRLSCRRKLYNYLYTQMLQTLMRSYKSNKKDKIHLLIYEKQEHFEWQTVEIRDIQMSRGIILDLNKPQTPTDIVYAKIMQAITDENYDHSTVAYTDCKPCVKNVPPVGNKLKELRRPLIASKRQEYFYVLFIIFLLVLIPFMDYMYHFVFKPVKLSFFQQIVSKIYKILNKLFPDY